MNIVIIRAFVRLRDVLATHKDLAEKIRQLEATQKQHGSVIVAVVQEIETLKQRPRRRRLRFGFYTEDK